MRLAAAWRTTPDVIARLPLIEVMAMWEHLALAEQQAKQ